MSGVVLRIERPVFCRRMALVYGKNALRFKTDFFIRGLEADTT